MTKPYSLTDAISDEILHLEEQIKILKKQDKAFAAGLMQNQRDSLVRIINRTRGYEYSYEVEDGEIRQKRKLTDRKKIEDENPALKKAADAYEITSGLVGN